MSISQETKGEDLHVVTVQESRVHGAAARIEQGENGSVGALLAAISAVVKYDLRNGVILAKVDLDPVEVAAGGVPLSRVSPDLSLSVDDHVGGSRVAAGTAAGGDALAFRNDFAVGGGDSDVGNLKVHNGGLKPHKAGHLAAVACLLRFLGVFKRDRGKIGVLSWGSVNLQFFRKRLKHCLV